MTLVKQYISEQFKDKKFRFKCECLLPLDFIGTVKDYNIDGEEILLYVEHNGKLITIGLNHPKLYIEEIL